MDLRAVTFFVLAVLVTVASSVPVDADRQRAPIIIDGQLTTQVSRTTGSALKETVRPVDETEATEDVPDPMTEAPAVTDPPETNEPPTTTTETVTDPPETNEPPTTTDPSVTDPTDPTTTNAATTETSAGTTITEQPSTESTTDAATPQTSTEPPATDPSTEPTTLPPETTTSGASSFGCVGATFLLSPLLMAVISRTILPSV